MDIKQWFDSNGSYADGVALYRQLPNCSQLLLRNFAEENAQNLLSLKYELKLALMRGTGTSLPKKEKNAPQPEKPPHNEPLQQEQAKQSAEALFKKETMADYPAELHPVFRQRVGTFYKACELKFKLNALDDDAEEEALKIILELEELWAVIDKCWDILNHWKEHKRILPAEESEDFTRLNGIQLSKKRDQLESNLSRRRKTLAKLEEAAKASPEDRALQNRYMKKKEELQQMVIDLETVRLLLLKEVG